MSLAGEARYQALLDEIGTEFPRFRIVKKHESTFQRAIGAALTAVTFGGQRVYLTSYQTTIGFTVYVTPDWDTLPADQRYVTMRHERAHLRQFRRYTLVGMAFLYLLVPLPLGLAYCRARFEWEGYAESIRASAEVYGRAHVESAAFKENIVRQFTSGAYGWMWPFPRRVRAWIDAEIAALG
jgi:hypothetical protein